MERYLIQLSKRARKDFKIIKKSGKKSNIRKIELFLREIEEHPRAGTGSPEQLKYFEGEIWSRRLNKKRPVRL